jgi:hypothetical protein
MVPLPRAGRRFAPGTDSLGRASGIADPDTGGSYTVKRYRSEKAAGDDDSWKHTAVRLEPLNPAYQPIVIAATEASDVRVIGELVEVLGGASASLPAEGGNTR